MKSNILVSGFVSGLIALSAVQSVSAEADSNAQAAPRPDSVGKAVQFQDQQGTAELQEKLLTKINDGLVNGSLSPAEASQLKIQLNKLNDQEAWYKSFNTEIPSEVILKDTEVLHESIRNLQPKSAVTAHTETALHGDIDELIGKALANNHITSGEAEKYYLRLAQLESNLESIKRSSTSPETGAQVNSNLREMRAELLKK